MFWIILGLIFLVLLTIVHVVSLHLKSLPLQDIGGIDCRGRVGQLKQKESFDDSWHILISVSEGFDDMYLNWWYWFRKLNISLPVTMVAEDANTWNKYKHSTDLFDVCMSHTKVEENVVFRIT